MDIVLSFVGSEIYSAIILEKNQHQRIFLLQIAIFEPVPLYAMSCKQTFSLFDFDTVSNKQYPRMPINDQLMSFVSQQEAEQHTPETPEPTNFDILLNKHLNNEEITDIELQQLPEHERNALFLIQNKGKDKKKRPDQCQKLFYKRAFKYSEHKFFKRCKNKSRKMSHFYHYHFDTVSRISGTPLTHFYHPNKKTKPGLEIGHKTFNNRYVHLLLKSKSFFMDTKEYHKMFVQDCMNQRKRKIISFTNSIRRIMKRAEEDSRILVKHLQSSQCKIPWTCQEIKEAWEIAQRDLEEVIEPDQQFQRDRHHREQEMEQQVPLGESLIQ